MASIREVAKLAHVAPSTVSRALNGSGYVSEKSKNKIKKAVEELDYIPNQWIRNLYKKRTGIIGVMTCLLYTSKTYFIKVVECNGTNSNQTSNKKNRIH